MNITTKHLFLAPENPRNRSGPSNMTPGMCAGENLISEKLSFGSVHTYLVDRCGEIIDCGERKIEIGRKMRPGGQYL